MIPKDTLWKGIIEDLVKDFLHYFFAEYVNQIDFAAGFSFLDKELEQLFPQSESKKRHADKLFQAKLINGQDQLFLVHVEIQGYNDPSFAARMFEYAYRIRDRYKKPLTGLAIYTNEDRRSHFTEYREAFMGSEFRYKFNTFTIADKVLSEIRKEHNLFGLVMEVAYQDLRRKKISDAQLLKVKIRLIRHLLSKRIEKRKINNLLIFIKYYTNFEQQEYLNELEENIDKILKPKKAMGIEEAVYNYLKEEGEARIKLQIINKIITRAWNKGMPISEIADLTNKTEEEVLEVVAEITTSVSQNEEEEE